MKRQKRKGVIIVLSALVVLASAALALIFMVRCRQIEINHLFISSKDIRGVDVSKYQMDIDMDKLAEQNIQFIYIKATEGSVNVDERFAQNWENAGSSSLIRGAYHFFSFDSDGDTQAHNYIDTVGDLTGSLPPVIDFEFYGDKEDNPPSKEDVVRELKRLLDDLEAEYGVKPIIYASGTPYNMFIKGEFDEYPRWVRSVYYHVNIDNGSNWLIWQYNDRGLLEGYSGGEKYIDLNVLNKNTSLNDLIIR